MIKKKCSLKANIVKITKMSSHVTLAWKNSASSQEIMFTHI